MSAPIFPKQVETHTKARIAHAFEKHQGRFLAVARRITRAEADAEDAVQDAFFNAIRKADTFDGRAQITTWLHRIVCNSALMQLRKQKRRPLAFFGDLTEVEQMGRCDSDSDTQAPAPSDVVHQHEVAEALREAFTALNETDQAIVWLRLVDGYSTLEVATEFGLSTSATKTRLHRARSTLQSSLGQTAVACLASSGLRFSLLQDDKWS